MGYGPDGRGIEMYIIAGYLVILFSIMILAGETAKIEKTAERNRFIQSYMAALQGFYQTIQRQIDMTRKFRHDLAKHIQTLEVLMGDQEESGLQEYAENLKQEYRKIESKGESKSEVVNAILSMKRQQCQEKQIPIFLHVEEKEYALVRDVDMVGILMNLLDNAIEENEKIELTDQRGIWMEMKETKQGEVWIKVKNNIRLGKKIDFHTEKKKKEEHGIGRGIIEYLIKQYHGEEKLYIDQEKNTFCETVILRERPQEDPEK